MNVTEGFTIAEKVILPLSGGIVCPLLSLGFYLIAKKRMQKKETVKSRAHVFYQMLSGILIGQFLCHTFIFFDVTYTLILVLVGYALMACVEIIGRMWNTNVQYVGPVDSQVDDELGLDKETMTTKPVVECTKKNMSTAIWQGQDVSKDRRIRRWMLGTLFVVLVMISIVDGILMVFRTASVALVICYYLNSIAMTVAVLSSMIHAKIHTEEYYVWGILAGIWCLAVFCSTIPVLANVPYSVSVMILENKVFISFYALAAGCVLRLQQYYHNQIFRAVFDRKENCFGMIVFVLSAAQAAVTSVWL
jgi:hypothetical protein